MITTSDKTEDDWTNFESSTISSSKCSIRLSNEKINNDDDAFGDYGEVQDSPKFQLPSLALVRLLKDISGTNHFCSRSRSRREKF